MWAIFGYKGKEDHYGTFLAEVKSKEEQEQVEEEARKNGYTEFSYSHPDGSLPNFTKAIRI